MNTRQDQSANEAAKRPMSTPINHLSEISACSDAARTALLPAHTLAGHFDSRAFGEVLEVQHGRNG